MCESPLPPFNLSEEIQPLINLHALSGRIFLVSLSDCSAKKNISGNVVSFLKNFSSIYLERLFRSFSFWRQDFAHWCRFPQKTMVKRILLSRAHLDRRFSKQSNCDCRNSHAANSKWCFFFNCIIIETKIPPLMGLLASKWLAIIVEGQHAGLPTLKLSKFAWWFPWDPTKCQLGTAPKLMADSVERFLRCSRQERRLKKCFVCLS